jgi:hypothetical protein
MALSSQHVTGFFVGLGAAALGFYMYKRNQDQIDQFLRERGIKIPGGSRRDPASMNLEDLVAEKERLEDIIAEREMAAEQPEAEQSEKTKK